jgi:hypothetical protein
MNKTNNTATKGMIAVALLVSVAIAEEKPKGQFKVDTTVYERIECTRNVKKYPFPICCESPNDYACFIEGLADAMIELRNKELKEKGLKTIAIEAEVFTFIQDHFCK